MVSFSSDSRGPVRVFLGCWGALRDALENDRPLAFFLSWNTNIAKVKVAIVILGNFVTHGEATVVRRRAPEIRNPCYIGKVDNIQPAIKDEPSCLPVEWDEVGVASRGKCKAVEEEETKDDHDTDENSPPELSIHGFFGMLLSLAEILEGPVEGVERPDIEGSQSTSQREDDQEHKWACSGEESKRVNEAKQEMCCCKPSHSDHALTQGVLNHTIAHTDNKQQEERERVSPGVENSYDCEENL
ncbi:hypothetical protein HG531_003194 [Fusarium graminearum]|nr:hypothetical protein HG531_003194 [Fusarium graminearum]